MELSRYQSVLLSKIRGQFTPDQFCARLFMDHDETVDPDNYLVMFHERFHYLQSIFTPYGQMRWGAFRTVTGDIIEMWHRLAQELKLPRRIPAAEYLCEDGPEGEKLAKAIWLKQIPYQLYEIIEYGSYNNDLIKVLKDYDLSLPEIDLQGEKYILKGIDILESYAKFEEAMLAEIIKGSTIDEIINPDKLDKCYYSALYYFVSEVGPERLLEFPIICELALCTPHIPLPCNRDSFEENTPSWRYVKLIKAIKDNGNLPEIDVNSYASFYAYANRVLEMSGFESIEISWESVETYVKQTDLSLDGKMLSAIKYKKEHPWMLSYPMCSPEFISSEYNQFEPYFVITRDGVLYNFDLLLPSELELEIHLQALYYQICGQISKYSKDVYKVLCGYTYIGANICPYLLNGQCDGHIDRESKIPEIVLDKDKNVLSGCSFELMMKTIGTSIHELSIGRIRPIGNLFTKADQ